MKEVTWEELIVGRNETGSLEGSRHSPPPPSPKKSHVKSTHFFVCKRNNLRFCYVFCCVMFHMRKTARGNFLTPIYIQLKTHKAGIVVVAGLSNLNTYYPEN